ncbi:MAG: PVC-type heme-binding CxxCH protein [Pirellula sp.]
MSPFTVRVHARVATIAIAIACATQGLAYQSTDPSVTADTPRVLRNPALPLDQVVRSIEVSPGFEVELVASEPLVRSPVAMQFDASGGLWVVEMVDYSEQDTQSLGRVSRLEDRDHDGVMDHATVVADRLSWPTAIACLERSTWVAAPPMVWQLGSDPQALRLDTAHSTQTPQGGMLRVLDGLGRQNVQGMANSFRWGIDGRLHLSTSSNGGVLVSPAGSPIRLPSTNYNVASRDLAFDLRTGQMSTVVGYGQHGMDFTPSGERLLTSNSDHLQQVVAWYLPELTDANLSRNVAWRRSIAEDGPQAEVIRISPVESWRALRTQMRLSGASVGLLEGNGRASGYFTSATGVTVYDGDQWLESSETMAFIADVGSNLVHRKRLIAEPTRANLVGQRMDPGTEFLRSTDTWFRPVQMSNGPDGCLYIVDMARETIEHPRSLPEPIKSQVDLTSGRELGRIWRVRAKDRPIRRTTDDLLQCTQAELRDHLSSSNGWHRETAAQLLVERSLREPLDTAPLQAMAMHHTSAWARLSALSVLAAVPEAWTLEVWQAAIRDSHPALRRWGVVFTERLPAATSREAVAAGLQHLSGDPDVMVCMAAAVRSEKWVSDPSQRAKLLVTWTHTHPDSDEMRAAVEFACRGETASRLWSAVAAEMTSESDSLLRDHWIDGIAYQMHLAGALEARVSGIDIAMPASPQDALLVASIARLMQRRLIAEGSATYRAIEQRVSEQIQPLSQRVVRAMPSDLEFNSTEGKSRSNLPDLVAWLRATSPDARRSLLDALLHSDPSNPLRVAAVDAWVGSDPQMQRLIIDGLSDWEPMLRSQALIVLLRHESGARGLLDWMENGTRTAGDLPPWVWQALRNSPNEDVRRRAGKWETKAEMRWEDVAATYREAWRHPGDSQRGLEHFRKWCASCHRVGDVGIAIGPSLDSYRVRPNEAIALAIAEPSREMDPKYEQQQIVTQEGRVVTGLLLQNVRGRLQLLTAQNEQVSLERDEIADWKASGRSMMPDGLLKELDPTALNDLIAFLRKLP